MARPDRRIAYAPGRVAAAAQGKLRGGSSVIIKRIFNYTGCAKATGPTLRFPIP